jgi:serine/threonine protein kinase
MIEKSLTIRNDTDTTHIRPEDDNSELNSSPKPSTQTANKDIIYAANNNYDTDLLGGMKLEIGSVIKDTYELVALLGEGGMGTVFKALNKVWAEVEARDPYVAIKVLKPELSANKQLVRSLYSDFDRTKLLANCPNIIKVHGFDRDGPHFYMTMEYLSGKTLAEYLNREPLNLTKAWFIFEGIGNALIYAHENNIIHRDIKPGNVIITHNDIVKVLDFGIASKINENEGDETKFSGHELGALTEAYASPEMQKDYPPDARDDIYAFACVIYEVLTGKQFYKQKTHKASLIHGLNSRQMEALNKALAFERDQRTSNIRELLDKLRPAKTPRVNYFGIGGGVLLITGLVLWKVLTQSPDIEQHADSQTIHQITVSPTPYQTATSIPTQAQAPVYAPNPVPQPATTVAPAIPTPEPEPSLISNESSYSSTSSDGIVQLQTSKPEYNNGDPFQLSFNLSQPSYVRVIDRDAKGQETMLRPNSSQPDKLLPADKEHVFPPKGINAPVQGPSGSSTVTIITSSHPFTKGVKLINMDGSISEQVLSGPYSWTQIRYTLHQ